MYRLIFSVAVLLIGCSQVFAARHYKGDVNNDGKIDLADMVMLAKVINGTATGNEFCDINVSGRVDDTDLQALADLILTEKQIDDSGLNVGIGGWEDGGEDFGGSVGARLPRASQIRFDIEGPKHDFDFSSDYSDLTFSGAESAPCGMLCTLKFPWGIEPNSDRIVELLDSGEMFDGHVMYGKPVIKREDYNQPELWFIIFSPDLRPLKQTSGRLARFYYMSDHSWGSACFSNCQIVFPGEDSVEYIQEHETEYKGWNYEFIDSMTIRTYDDLDDVKVGTHVKFYVDIEPYHATNKNVEWSSSDPAVATVDQDGNVVAISGGHTVITVSAIDGSGMSASVVLTVKVKSVEGDINKDLWTDLADMVLLAKAIKNGESDNATYDIDKSGRVDDADLHALADLILASEPEYIESETGIRFDVEGPKHDFGKSCDYADLILESDSSAPCGIAVFMRLPEELDVDGDSPVELLESGGMFDGHVIYGKPVVERTEWLLQLKFILFSPDLTPLKQASGPLARINYTADNTWGSALFRSCKVVFPGSDKIGHVSDDYSRYMCWEYIPIESMRIESYYDLDNIQIGANVDLRVEIEPYSASNKNVEWSSSNPDVATVDQDGNVNAVSAGKTVITVRSVDNMSMSASIELTVKDPLGAVELIKSDGSPIDIYDVSGRMIEKSADPSKVEAMAPGVYIVVSGSSQYKVVL